ncbi:hypothetical protein B0O99DRAFT_693822 [Bisporella sp. PMI_857]|nr:hypothetical protein B0O99DRAFT_693822 [Bisporella sp. PMI_857]
MRIQGTCTGDATYAPTPLTGSSTTLAVTGAYIFAGELNQLEDGEHPSKALEAYENAFRPFFKETQNGSFFVQTLAHPRTAWKRWMPQILVLAISKLAAIPWLVNKFDGAELKDDGFPLPQYLSLDVKYSK